MKKKYLYWGLAGLAAYYLYNRYKAGQSAAAAAAATTASQQNFLNQGISTIAQASNQALSLAQLQ